MTATDQLARPSRVRSLRAFVQRNPLTSYFVLAFAGTWIVLLVPLLGGNGLGLLPYTLPDIAALLMFVLVSTFFGPTLAAYVVTAISEGKEGVKQFLRRYWLWRVGVQWYLVAIFGFMVLFLISVTISQGLGPLLTLVEQWTLLFTSFLPTFLLFAVLGLFGEEPGWRGFALPRLQARNGPVRGSLILGLLHGIWHFPAFFVVGALAPFTLPGFTTFLIVAVAGTFLYTWIFNNTRGSILLAILTHAASNAASALVNNLVAAPPDPNGGWINVFVFGAAALLLIALTRGRLGYKEPG
jgi:membrane protease YdiL (CAAX protease family)